MAIDIVTTELLSKKLVHELNQKVRLKAYCNVEGDFTKGMGDTVIFQEFPTFESDVWGVAGSKITGTDLVIGSDTLTIDKRLSKLVQIVDWKKRQNNFDLQGETVKEMRNAIERKEEDYIIAAAIASAVASSNLMGTSTGSLATETTSTIYTSLLWFKEFFEDKGSNTEGEGQIVIAVNYNIHKLLKAANIYDSTEAGLRARQMGAFGSILDGNIHIVPTGRLPKVDSDANGVANYTYMVGFRKGAVSFANGMISMDIREPADQMVGNILYERYLGAGVVSTSAADGIAIKYLSTTNMTSTSVFAPVV